MKIVWQLFPKVVYKGLPKIKELGLAERILLEGGLE